VKKLDISRKRLLVPELLLLAKAGGVNGVLVATVHTVNAVVVGIAIGVGVGPLHEHRQFSQPPACNQPGRNSSNRILVDQKRSPLQVPSGFPMTVNEQNAGPCPAFCPKCKEQFTPLTPFFKVPALRIEIARTLYKHHTITYCRLRLCTVPTHPRYS